MPLLECPTCGAQIQYADRSEIPYRPFCSQRCQLIDLGKWLKGEYRVTEELPPETPGESEREPAPRPPGD